MGDGVATRSKLEEFKNVDYSFASSRECTFLEQLLNVRTYINTLKFKILIDDNLFASSFLFVYFFIFLFLILFLKYVIPHFSPLFVLCFRIFSFSYSRI